MSSGMNVEQAKEYAKTMTYSEAVSNVRYSKGIKYRKATMIKLRELAEIADRIDRKTENSSEKPNNCEDCIWSVCNYSKAFKDEPQTDYERGKKDAWKIAQIVFDSTVTLYEAEDVAKQIDKDINVLNKSQADCPWK